jgi:hypothetical protein
VVLANLPRTSAYVRSAGGEAVEWSVTDYLLAIVCDALAAANWQRGGGGGARPHPLTRPGQRKPRIGGGGNVMTLDKAREWRKKRRER